MPLFDVSSGALEGTAFPSSPDDGERFYRTDTRIFYQYNATVGRWLSIDRKYVGFVGPDQLQATTAIASFGRLPVFEDIYIETWQTSVLVSGTNDASDYYTLALYGSTPANVSTTIESFTTASDPVAHNTIHSFNIAALLATTTYAMLGISVNVTGSPGNHYITSLLVLRSAG